MSIYLCNLLWYIVSYREMERLVSEMRNIVCHTYFKRNFMNASRVL